MKHAILGYRYPSVFRITGTGAVLRAKPALAQHLDAARAQVIEDRGTDGIEEVAQA
jgi:hypothetical protein